MDNGVLKRHHSPVSNRNEGLRINGQSSPESATDRPIEYDEHFQDSVNAHYDKQEENNKQQQKEIDNQINSQKFKPMNTEGIKQSIAEDHGFSDWDTLIAKLTESNELTLLKIYIDEVIVGYADAKIFDELEAPAMEFENKVLKTLKSMTLSMAAHPDCVKGSEFFDLVSIAEKVIEGV